MEEIQRRIIIVDDVNPLLLSLKTRLGKRYDIYPAQSAENMYEMLARFIPDLILLDINMPGCDGYETIKKLKADARFAGIPVIFLSSKSDKESKRRGMSLGAVDYITKPFSEPELVERIEAQFSPEKPKDDKPVILAVDDNPSILKSVNYLLGSQYKVYTLSEPEKIKELLSKIKPDLFLLDCNMPVLSGFDLVRIIRRFSDHAETPIVFLTSEGTIDNINAAVNLGACDFIVKPVNEEILREKTALHLADFALRRRIRSI